MAFIESMRGGDGSWAQWACYSKADLSGPTTLPTHYVDVPVAFRRADLLGLGWTERPIPGALPTFPSHVLVCPDCSPAPIRKMGGFKE